jgi:hypothetical protein
VKAARLYPTLPTNSGRHSTLTGDDVSLYGEHQCASAGNVGVFLDTVIANSASNGTTAASAADSHADTNAVGEGENSAKATRKAGEKADTYNNFVRKNLKSGGTSKYLNRKPGKVSMAKQRWMNRSGGAEGGGGSRYGSKYGRRNGGGSGNSNDNGDQAYGGAGGGGYNKPRGLQQWGLDSLEMSLDLIASQADVQVSTEVEGDESAQATTAAAVATSVDTVPPLDSASNRPGTAVSNASTAAPAHTNTNPVSRSTTAYPQSRASKDPATTAAIKTTKPTTAATAATAATKPTAAATKAPAAPKDRVSAKMTARQREHERIQAMTALAPKCPGHSMASKLLVVKKSGANKVTSMYTSCTLAIRCDWVTTGQNFSLHLPITGQQFNNVKLTFSSYPYFLQGKYFYSCTFPAEQRCNFFMWAEVRLLIAVLTMCRAKSGKKCSLGVI